jgi:hypothetical protein
MCEWVGIKTSAPLVFHVSEESGIERFEPRQSKFVEGPVVWAIDAEHLRNYLLPRQCPRVTYYAGPASSYTDVQRFLGVSKAVVAVESGWFAKVRSCHVYCYQLPPDTFECLDECAGYFVSRVAVTPARVEIYDDVIAELLKRGVEIRFVPNLWVLHDAIAASSLQFSMIRMSNAIPRSG